MPVRPCRREGGKGSVRLFLRLMGVASVGCILAAEGLPYRSRGWIGTWTTHGRHMDGKCQRDGETVHSPDGWGEWGPTWICAEMGAVVMSTLGVHTSGEQT